MTYPCVCHIDMRLYGESNYFLWSTENAKCLGATKPSSLRNASFYVTAKIVASWHLPVIHNCLTVILSEVSEIYLPLSIWRLASHSWTHLLGRKPHWSKSQLISLRIRPWEKYSHLAFFPNNGNNNLLTTFHPSPTPCLSLSCRQRHKSSLQGRIASEGPNKRFENTTEQYFLPLSNHCHIYFFWYC